MLWTIFVVLLILYDYMGFSLHARRWSDPFTARW